MSPAQSRALALLAGQPLIELALPVYRVQPGVLLKLRAQGLCKYRPYGKPPSWAITTAGRATAAASKAERSAT